MSAPDRSPDLFDRAWAAWCRAAVAPIGENWRANGAAGAFVAVLALLLLTSPALFLNDNGLDVFIPLDGAWRMHAGQWPHLDFSTPIGALYYVLLGLAGPSAKAPILATLVLLPVTAGIAFGLTRNRAPTPLRLGMVLLVVMLTVSPRTLDATGLISHLASYNKHSWAFLAAIAAGVLLEPTERTPRGMALDIALLTVSAVALFYLKVTWFALGGALLLWGLVFGGTNRPVALASGVLTLVLIGLGFALGETNAAYLGDLRKAAEAGAGGAGLLRTERLFPMVETNLLGIVTVFGAVVALIRTSENADEESAASWTALKVLGAMGLAMGANLQAHDYTVPLLGIFTIPVFLHLRRRLESRGGSPTPVRLVGALAGLLLAMPIGWDTLAIARHAGMSRSAETVPYVDHEDGPGRDLRLPRPPSNLSLLPRVRAGELPADAYDNLDPAWNLDHPVILAEALDLLKTHGQAGKRVGSLTFSPSFPWLLGAPPPRLWPAWHDYERTFSAADGAGVAKVISETDAILVPRVWCIEGITDAYLPAIETEFRKAGESDLWTLWVRDG